MADIQGQGQNRGQTTWGWGRGQSNLATRLRLCFKTRWA